jgi:hypothetical protein
MKNKFEDQNDQLKRHFRMNVFDTFNNYNNKQQSFINLGTKILHPSQNKGTITRLIRDEGTIHN